MVGRYGRPGERATAVSRRATRGRSLDVARSRTTHERHDGAGGARAPDRPAPPSPAAVKGALRGSRRGALLIIALEGTLASFAHIVSGLDHLVGDAPIAVDRSGSRICAVTVAVGVWWCAAAWTAAPLTPS